VKERDLPAIVCRFFNTVGPGQTGRYGMVLPTFVSQALRGSPITVYGDGEQSRCFAHVRDVVDATIRLLNSPSAVGEVFNIGTDREVTIRELAETVKASTGSSSDIVQVPYDEAYAKGFEDMRRRVPSLEKLEATIGFRPSISLDVIIADVVADLRSRVVL
jgi:UDP-glucose 4-epimerase